MKSTQLVKLASKLALTKKAEDVKILDLRKITSMADSFLICSAEVDVQVRAIADAIEFGLKEKNIRAWRKEGLQTSSWIILDYVDVVIHVMKKELRSYYQLESLWSDAKISTVEDKPKKLLSRKNHAEEKK